MRLATRIGHYFSPINPIVIILGALWTLAFSEARDSLLYQSVDAILMTVLFVPLACELSAHYGKECALCIEASVPLNPGAQVEREDWMLRLAHRFMGWHIHHIRLRGRIIPIPGSLAAVLAGLALLSVAKSVFDLGDSTVAWLNLFGLAIPMAVTLWAVYRHDRLQLWCPYCRRGGGGEDEQVPDSTPDPSISR